MTSPQQLTQRVWYENHSHTQTLKGLPYAHARSTHTHSHSIQSYATFLGNHASQLTSLNVRAASTPHHFWQIRHSLEFPNVREVCAGKHMADVSRLCGRLPQLVSISLRTENPDYSSIAHQMWLTKIRELDLNPRLFGRVDLTFFPNITALKSLHIYSNQFSPMSLQVWASTLRSLVIEDAFELPAAWNLATVCPGLQTLTLNYDADDPDMPVPTQPHRSWW